MKKICLVLLSLHCGGSERVAVELAEFFSAKKDLETHILLLTRSEKFYNISERIILHEPGFNYGKYSKLTAFLKTGLYLRKTIRRVNPDALLSFSDRYNPFVLLSCLFLKLRIYISYRKSPDAFSSFFYKILQRILYLKATGIIVQTSIAKKFMFEESGHKNIEVIPNPIRAIKNNNPERKNIILNVGRFVKSKRQVLLLEIFSKTNYLNWTLIFLGDGPQKERAREKAFDLGVSSNVVFVGNHENIDEYYSKSKIFAFTSNSEGFPNALGEALNTPLACISFDCISGPSDLIKDGVNGFLIPLDDLREYKKKLILLMEDESLRSRFEEQAKFKILEYSLGNIGEKFYNFIFR